MNESSERSARGPDTSIGEKTGASLLYAAALRGRIARYALATSGVLFAIAVALIVYANRPIAVEVASIEKNVPIRVFGLGTVEARVMSKIGFEVGATLVELHADHGDRVTKGQVLARLASSEQEAKVAKARAALLIAETNINRADANLERARAVMATTNWPGVSVSMPAVSRGCVSNGETGRRRCALADVVARRPDQSRLSAGHESHNAMPCGSGSSSPRRRGSTVAGTATRASPCNSSSPRRRGSTVFGKVHHQRGWPAFDGRDALSAFAEVLYNGKAGQ